MAPHSSTLAWKIPWTEEPGRLQSMESRRVGYDWATSLSLFTSMHWRRKWQPTPVFLPGAWWAAIYGVAQSRTWLKRLSSSSSSSSSSDSMPHYFSSVQSSHSVLYNSLRPYGLPSFPVHHWLLELTQTHVHWVGDAIQLSHPLSSPFPTFNFSQYQDLFQWVNSLHQVAKVLEFQLQHQSFQWIFRTDFL